MKRNLGIAAAAATCGLALVPATGSATVYPFGSSLTATADRPEARQADTVYWQTTFADGRSPVAPVDGQIRLVRIKGIALSDRTAPIGAPPVGGERDFHIQVMRPLPNGTFEIRNPGGTSGFMSLPPRTADPQTVTDYSSDAGQIVNLCVRAGDSVVFNTIGGWDAIPNRTGPYPDGTPLQIFANAPNAIVSEFTGDNQTNNGAIIPPRPGPGRELLMQVTIGTGAHGTALCAGGTAGVEGPLPLSAPDPGGPSAPPPPPPQVAPPPPPPQVQLATLPKSQKVTVSKKGKLSVSLFCKLTISRCKGKVRVVRRTGKAISLGSSKFDIAGKKTGHATIFLNRTGRRLFFKQGKGRLSVKLVAVTDPGGASRTSSLTTTLRKR